MKKHLQLLWMICFLLLSSTLIYAQCNINGFTLTPTNGVCVQDGAVKVTVPGGVTCSNTTATIRLSGTTTDLDFKTLTNAGVADFINLKPGKYDVRLQQGGTSLTKEVTVSSSYNPIVVTASGQNTTCSSKDPQYKDNGKITVQFSGGTGPFRIDISAGGTIVKSQNVTTGGTYLFEDLAPGNYTTTVTDISSACSSAEARSVTVIQTNWVPLTYSMVRRQLTADCKMYMRIEVNDGNRAVLRQAGNATYTIEGDPTVYNLIPLGNNATDLYIFRTNYDLPENKNITFTLNDGCSTIVKTTNTRSVVKFFEANELKLLNNDSCQTTFSFNYRTWERDVPSNTYYWNFSEGRTVSFYAEVPASSNNWELVSTDKLNVNMNGVAGWTQFQTTHINTRIKLVFSDSNGCNAYEEIVDGRNRQLQNNLDKVNLVEVSGVLEGTSTISVDKIGGANWSGTESFSYPLTFNLVRKDGQQSITINPTQPYSLAGSYTVNFPFTKRFETAPVDARNNPTYWTNSRPMFGDLPLGEYVLTITDACGYTVTREINLTKPAGYNQSLTYEVGCAASNVVYDMDPNANTQDLGRVYVYQNNNGVRGSLVKTFNPNQILSGSFTNITPGNYFLVFKDINYYPKILTTIKYDTPEYTISVARNTTGVDQEYFVPFTVAPYQQITFSTTSLFCDPSNSNTGILAVTATGIPVGFITYSLWKAGLDPNTDAPTATYRTNDLTETSHVFQNLAAGEYTVRVSNECGFTTQTVKLVPGSTEFPEPSATPEKICTPGEEVELSIPLPTSLFDIEWLQGTTVIGTDNSIKVAPMTTTTYTLKYSLKTSLGCTSTYSNTKTITIEVGNCFCYKDGLTTGTALDTTHGITSLGRAGANSENWPMVRKGAWTVLESNTKGFVINRVASTAALSQIANPIEGMAVYDQDAGCMKIYTSTDNGTSFGWKCFSTQTCPDY